MTDAMIELAKRAVACKGWRWSNGMLWLVKRGYPLEDYAGRVVLGYTRPHEALPVPTDPATIGCLLALVRVAYSDPYAGVWYSSDHGHEGDRWSFYSKAFSFSGHASEAEALVAALEAAL